MTWEEWLNSDYSLEARNAVPYGNDWPWDEFWCGDYIGCPTTQELTEQAGLCGNCGNIGSFYTFYPAFPGGDGGE
jgi:hypothetical protein